MSDDQKKNLEDLQKSFSDTYDASSIGGELGLGGVRLSISQYLGSKGVEGAVQGTIEITQNSVDEASAYFNFFKSQGIAKEELPDFRIDITIDKEDNVVIEDTGRGIPVAINTTFNKPAIEAAFEYINVGGKGKGYVKEGSTVGYAAGTTIGKHGSGAACTNASSEYFHVDTFLMSDGKHYRVEYAKKDLTVPTHYVGEAPEGKHGTRVSFKPDIEVFDLYSDKHGEVTRFFNYDDFAAIIKEYAYNTEKISFNLHFQNDDGSWKHITFNSEDHNPVDRLKPYAVNGEIFENLIYDEEKAYSLKSYICISGTRERILSCNMVPLKGGTHEDAVSIALNQLIPQIMETLNTHITTSMPGFKPITRTQYDNLRLSVPSQMVGMYLSISMAEPDYTSQAKDFLVTPKIKQSITDKFFESLTTSLTDLRERIIETAVYRAVNALEAQVAVEKEKERRKKEKERRERYNELVGKNSNEIEGTGEGEMKVIHASDTNHSNVILYLAEGDSATNSLVKARDSRSETIIPIDSRPPNVMNHEQVRLESMPKFRFLFKYFAKRYRAIILAPDPDPDGDYMRMLIIMMLYTYPEFRDYYLLGGRVFNLTLPKFIGIKGQGENAEYALLADYEARMNHMKEAGPGWDYISNKGLGSIAPEILRGILNNEESFSKIDPSTVQPGIKYVERFLTDTRFKRNYITAKYGSDEFQSYTHIRSQIIKRHEINYDISDLDSQFTETWDLSDVKKETHLERVIEEVSDTVNRYDDLTEQDMEHDIVRDAFENEFETNDSEEDTE